MLQWLNLKIIASIAAVGVVSVAAIGGTYANFTATPTTISNNAFTTGSLTMSRSGSGAVFSAATMVMGDSATGSVTITNTGTLPGVYTLSGSMSGSSALGGQLHLVIYKDTDGDSASKIYDGSLSGLGSLALGTFAASGGAHTYHLHVNLPSTGTDAGDNVFQGLSATESLTWSATQA
jgi:spore coat-associated protein N